METSGDNIAASEIQPSSASILQLELVGVFIQALQKNEYGFDNFHPADRSGQTFFYPLLCMTFKELARIGSLMFQYPLNSSNKVNVCMFYKTPTVCFMFCKPSIVDVFTGSAAADGIIQTFVGAVTRGMTLVEFQKLPGTVGDLSTFAFWNCYIIYLCDDNRTIALHPSATIVYASVQILHYSNKNFLHASLKFKKLVAL